MLTISRSIFIALLLACITDVAARASESKAVNSIPDRLVSSAAYGVGTVRWGAVAQTVNERAQLFTYEIRYGADNAIRICTERELHPGQKTFFAIKHGKLPRNRSCASNTLYIPANQFTQFIYAGFDDLIGEKTWFEIPPGSAEKFGCTKIDLMMISIKSRYVDGRSRSDVHGAPGVGSYFSDASLMQCLKLLALPQYKVLPHENTRKNMGKKHEPE